MKCAAIFHGTGQNETCFWYPWMKAGLEQQGYEVWLPSMPADQEGFADLEMWKDYYLNHSPARDYDIVIGHSAGCPHILNLLSQDLLKARHAYLVAGFINPIPGMDKSHQTFPKNLTDQQIMANCSHFTIINADNDPWGCDHIQGEAMRQRFGGTLIICTGEGHFGSEAFQQPYDHFPLLLAQTMLTNK